MIKLSFILPCYNVAPYVGRCIESIEAQDISQAEYEVICVDDCSKDNTVEVIKEYQKQYPNIRLICHTENKTAGGARNTGMDAAKGEYLWFVDPDDAIVEKILGTLWQQIEEKEVDILFFNYNYIGEDNVAHPVLQFDGNQKVMRGQDFFMTYCKRKRLAEVPSIWREVFRAKFLKENDIRYPEIKSSQDVVFAWHSYLLALKITAISTTAYNHMRRAASTTGSKGTYKAINLISTSIYYTEEIWQILNTIPMHEQYKKDLQHDIEISVNDETQKLFRMSISERNLYFDELINNSELVDKFRPYMNRRSKILYNYNLPRWVWNTAIILYKKYDEMFRRKEYN